MDAFSLAIVGSLVVYLVVGNLAGRKVKHLDDYFVAGRNAPTILILGTLVASVIGTNSFMGDLGMAYSGYATPLIWSAPISVLGYIFGGLFFGQRLCSGDLFSLDAIFFGLEGGALGVVQLLGADAGIFNNTGRLTATAAQVVKLGATNLTTADDFNAFHQR